MCAGGFVLGYAPLKHSASTSDDVFFGTLPGVALA
jgi:hypothetical protein